MSTLNPDKAVRLFLRIGLILNFHASLAGVLYNIVQGHNLVVPIKVVVGAVCVGSVSDVVTEGEDALELAE